MPDWVLHTAAVLTTAVALCAVLWFVDWFGRLP